MSSKSINKKINKITIIGAGTVGCMAASYFSSHTAADIEWIYDSEKAAQSVGEGSTLPFGRALWGEVNMGYGTLEAIGGSIKKGIRKIGYGGIGNYLHEFPLGDVAIHFNSEMLQKYIPSVLEKKGVDLVDKKILNHDEIDADYIIDCSGRPKDFSDFNQAEHIAVNAAYVMQSPCQGPLFDYTLTVARPYGWIFAIPLMNRVSIGYMYNKDISTIDEVKVDLQEFVTEYGFNMTDQINSFTFNNYRRKENFTDRVAYNGNASYFLEPLEATSVGTADHINQTVLGMMNQDVPLVSSNAWYEGELKSAEQMIMLHYLNGSKYKTPFWDYAGERAAKSLDEMIKSSKFRDIAALALANYKDPAYPKLLGEPGEYGQWPAYSYLQNFKGLGIAQRIDNKLREYETQ
jgi:hypothetical protein